MNKWIYLAVVFAFCFVVFTTLALYGLMFPPQSSQRWLTVFCAPIAGAFLLAFIVALYYYMINEMMARLNATLATMSRK